MLGDSLEVFYVMRRRTRFGRDPDPRPSPFRVDVDSLDKHLDRVRSLDTILTDFEDNRRWHPDPHPPAMSIRRRSDARLRVAKSSSRLKNKYDRVTTPGSLLSFVVPDTVVKCIRRKQRREVIHAKKLHHKGAAARLRRLTDWSSIVCK